jgi:hypothetical protein
MPLKMLGLHSQFMQARKALHEMQSYSMQLLLLPPSRENKTLMCMNELLAA